MTITIKSDLSTIFDENNVCVVVDGYCNHASYTQFYIDRDGEEYSVEPPDYIWVSEERECNHCGATQIVETGEWINEVYEGQ